MKKVLARAFLFISLILALTVPNLHNAASQFDGQKFNSTETNGSTDKNDQQSEPEDYYYYNYTDILPEISGRYVDPDSRYEIEFPVGWIGAELFGIAIVGESTNAEAGMMVFAIPHSRFNTTFWSQENLDRASQQRGDRCIIETYTYTQVNQLESLHLVDSCYTPTETKTSMYGFMSKDHVIVIFLLANSAAEHDKYRHEFEQSINSLNVTNPVPFRTGMAQLYDLKKETHEFTAKNIPVEVSVESNSKISNFNLDEEDKRVSLKVNGENGTNGLTLIEIDEVLEGPYTVTIDGNETNDFVVAEEEVSGRNTLEISYTHSEHDIVITGTNVIPEFPLPTVGIIASLMGLVVVLGRKKI